MGLTKSDEWVAFDYEQFEQLAKIAAACKSVSRDQDRPHVQHTEQ